MAKRFTAHSAAQAVSCCLLIAFIVLGQSATAAQRGPSEVAIGTIDFFGVRDSSLEKLREALTFKEGEMLSVDSPLAFAASKKKLMELPGTKNANITAVCCTDGRVSLFVGIQEAGAPVLQFNDAPTGAVRLEQHVLDVGREFESALRAAVLRGQAQEDDSQGHALARDPAVRAAQEHFIAYARTGTAKLRKVLRNSADKKHRALAAMVIAYSEDKQAVVPDLVVATMDPDDGVRNNAMRSLAVFGAMQASADRVAPRVPYDVFVALLNSPSFTDRNKASAALAQLTRYGDAELMTVLRRDALPALVEMARWKAKSHAFFAFSILARMAGLTEADALEYFNDDRRETVIAAVRGKKQNE